MLWENEMKPKRRKTATELKKQIEAAFAKKILDRLDAVADSSEKLIKLVRPIITVIQENIREIRDGK
jgi:hypothetical protein